MKNSITTTSTGTTSGRRFGVVRVKVGETRKLTDVFWDWARCGYWIWWWGYGIVVGSGRFWEVWEHVTCRGWVILGWLLVGLGMDVCGFGPSLGWI